MSDAVRIVRGPVALAAAAGLVWQAAAVAVPWVLQRAVDDGVVDGDRRALAAWIAVLLALGLVRWGGDAARHWYVETSGARAAAAVRRRLTDHLLALEPPRLHGIGRGQLVARATSDVDTLWVWVAGIATLVTSAFTLGAVLVALVSLGWLLALVGLAAVPVAAVVALVHVERHRRAASAVARATGEVTDVVSETVHGIRTIKGLGAEPMQLARTDARSRALTGAALGLARVEAIWLASSTFVPTAAITAGLAVGGWAVLDGRLTVGALVAFAGWMALLVDATVTLTERLATRGEATAAAARLAEVMSIPPTVRSPDQPVRLPRSEVERDGLDVVVDQVTVVRSGRPVLDGVSLDVDAATWTAIVGPSGAGKSTLLRLLARLDDADRGRVLLAGTDVRAVALAEVRRVVGHVGQHPVLLTGTLADNLRIAAPEAPDVDLLDVLAAVCADDVLDRVGGLHGPIRDGGLDLSGGQRQRIALARAMVGRPRLLVLDDPTSAVDPARETAVLAGIRTWLPRATVVIATHRPVAAAAADQLVVLDGGHVDHDGDPSRVLAAHP